MIVLPLLLLLMQTMFLVGQTEAGLNQNATATTLSASNNNNNATAAIKTAKTIENLDKNLPLLARSVTSTNNITNQASTVIGVATTSTTTVTSTQAPSAGNVSNVTITNATTVQQVKPTIKLNKLVADNVSLSDIKNSNGTSNNNNSSSSNVTPATNNNNNNGSISSSTTSAATSSITSTTNRTASTATTATTTTKATTTSTTTTSTTTMRPKKPLVTSSMDKHLEGEPNEDFKPTVAGSASMAPNVQELSSSLSNHGENEYIVPIISIMLAVPLAIAMFIIIYRRFRDLWSTRHYRRMDFLVDGMYND